MQLVVRKATDNDIAFLEANLEKMKTTTDDMHMHDHVKFTYDKIVEHYNSKSEVTV